LLRPGYQDGQGHQSTGVRGLTTGDNYTPEVVDATADGIERLRQLHHARAVVIAGHSGGAAIAANILGRHPSTADRSVLVSCPCDLERWREHMHQLQHAQVWTRPVTSLSPLALVPSVKPGAHVIVIAGDHDETVPPAIGRAYHTALAARGIDSELIEV